MSDVEKVEVQKSEIVPKAKSKVRRKPVKPVNGISARLEDVKKTNLILKIFLGVAALAILAFTVVGVRIALDYNTVVQKVNESALITIEKNRQSLIDGLYSVNIVIEKEIPPRADRLEVFMRKAKGIILEINPETDMSDEEINQLLKVNFDLSEQYSMNPYIFLSFAAAESSFRKLVVSSAGAKGIVQFMPSTMKLVVGDAYIDDIEFNPVESCRAWYKYVSVLSSAVDGDLKWVASAYLTQTAIQFKNTGKTVEEFMKWLTSWSENSSQYPFIIVEQYKRFKEK